MKRDPELIRDILLAVEAHDGKGFMPLAFPGFSKEQIHYHIGLLVEAGFVHAVPFRGEDTTEWNPTALRWDGCEFLDAARDDTVWRTARRTAGEKVASLSFDVLKELLTATVRGLLNLG